MVVSIYCHFTLSLDPLRKQRKKIDVRPFLLGAAAVFAMHHVLGGYLP